MSWNSLKAGIAAIIRANGNQEITGTNMQNVLYAMVNGLGQNATFAGVATPETIPPINDGPMFYIASQPGIYPNFNGARLVDSYELGVFVWNGSSWLLQGIQIGFNKSIRVDMLQSFTNDEKETALINLGIRDKLLQLSTLDDEGSSSDFGIADKNGNVVLRCSNGHIKTKNFDSNNVRGITYDEIQLTTNILDLSVMYDIECSDLYVRYELTCDELIADSIVLEGEDLATKLDGILAQFPITESDIDNSDLSISDELGNVILKLSGGHIQSKEFDSRNVIGISRANGKTVIPSLESASATITALSATNISLNGTDIKQLINESSGAGNMIVDDDSEADLNIGDMEGNVIAQFKDGHFKTLNFDSRIGVVTNNKDVDLIVFCGQSNMAGRGVSALAPPLTEGAGYEFRAVTDPSKLYAISEPFGVNENNANINDGNKKTGSMVTSFVNEYYRLTGNKVIAVSASQGGTSSAQWKSGMAAEAASRFTAALTYLEGRGYNIKHKYMVWCQGETDGDNSVTAATYRSNIADIWAIMKNAGCEKMFFIRIGEINVSPYTAYDTIISAQTQMCQEIEDYILISTQLASFRSMGLMKDAFHYTQQGYNIIGQQAATNLAYYTNNGKEPEMWDNKLNSLYYSKTNY